MKDKIIAQYLTPLREIIVDSLKGENINTFSALGNPDSIKRKLRTFKYSLINPKPYIFSNLKLSLRLSYTIRNEEFYRYGPDKYLNYDVNENIILFFSDSLIDRLYQNDLWCVDGTFDVVPKGFYQLYTLSFLKNGHVYPCIFVILKNKKKETYNAMFNLIFSIKGIPRPAIIISDFELAAISAMKESFQNTQISCCSFHLGQALQRKLKENVLFLFYKSNNIIRKFVKSLIALSYVEKSMIRMTFYELRNHSQFPEMLNLIYDYFFNCYIGHINDLSNEARYPVDLWHSLDKILSNIPRTNNAIEGWHNAFSNSFLNSKHSFPLFVDRLRNEEETIQQKIIWSTLNYEPKQKKIYSDMERNLKNFIENTENKYGANYVFSLLDYLFY